MVSTPVSGACADHNLSPRPVQRLADLYPNSSHVQSVGLEAASDRTVWEYARRQDYLIVTKDADFGELLLQCWLR